MDKEAQNIITIFKSWTQLKIKIHFSQKEIYPKSREVWWVSLGQNIGVEINGKNNNFERPVLVLKVFNRWCVLVAPISSSIRNDQYCIKFVNINREENIVNLSQVRVLSTKRLIRKIGEFSPSDFKKVKDVFTGLM
ncbi:MAG TPA: type II toxin-antitoxin system PemK/MazF family toxin [Candidatus Paceibacterota bacterium]|nr:type II toxin-antitoxin system PemK/MazF family toxin [Candidatus Paceibacterota bacterium]